MNDDDEDYIVLNYVLPPPPVTFPPEFVSIWNRLLAIKPLTKKNAQCLEFCGYLYRNTKKRERESIPGVRLSWVCKTVKCRGTATSVRLVANGADTDIQIGSPHTTEGLNRCCQLEEHEVVINKAKLLLKEMCLSNVRFSVAEQTIVNLLEAYDPEIAFYFDQSGGLAQAVKRARHRIFAPVPQDYITAFNVPLTLQNTFKGDRFMLRNTRFIMPDNSGARVTIFGTKEFLGNLLKMKRAFADGTFDIVPQPFTQLFSIHAFVGGTLIPFLYVFMSHKSKELYKQVFEWIKGFAVLNNIQIAWEKFTVDFESGLLPALKESFPQVQLTCCYFHFTQAIIRKNAELGLSIHYKDNLYGVKKFIWQVFVLAFLPADEVAAKFALLPRPVFNIAIPAEAAASLLFDQLIAYLIHTWVGSEAGPAGPAVVPMFPPAYWSVYEVDDDHRTNNNLESWHKQIASKCGGPYKKVYEVIEVLKHEQLYSEAKKTKLLGGLRIGRGSTSLKQRQKYQRLNELRDYYMDQQISQTDYFNAVFFAIYRQHI